jgi:hypothetical protein
VVVIAFNAGGFAWLARNHFHAVNGRLDRIDATLTSLTERVSHIEGKLEK